MKNFVLLSLLCTLFLTSCASINVRSDYDKNAPFASYKTFAFSKSGIDAAEISDLDKKRIMHAIQTGLEAKGMQINENPDVLITFHTSSTEQVNISPSYGWGWGWGPFYGNQTFVSNSTRGTLFIDIIEAKTKSLVWQGEGKGGLDYTGEKRDERIAEFVNRILNRYPPELK